MCYVFVLTSQTDPHPCIIQNKTVMLNSNKKLLAVNPSKYNIIQSWQLGILYGGSPMSPVDFKKWPCPVLLILKFPVDFKIA